MMTGMIVIVVAAMSPAQSGAVDGACAKKIRSPTVKTL